jgi:hypothetical protein
MNGNTEEAFLMDRPKIKEALINSVRRMSRWIFRLK